MIKEIEQIKSITLKDLEFDIVWKWGGDMKFLLNVYGLNAANSNYCCFWCKCHKKDFSEIDYEKWTITDTKKGARSVKEALRITVLKKKEFGYILPPLTSIEFSDVCVDL